jgi:hypothetical protein
MLRQLSSRLGMQEESQLLPVRDSYAMVDSLRQALCPRLPAQPPSRMDARPLTAPDYRLPVFTSEVLLQLRASRGRLADLHFQRGEDVLDLLVDDRLKDSLAHAPDLAEEMDIGPPLHVRAPG